MFDIYVAFIKYLLLKYNDSLQEIKKLERKIKKLEKKLKEKK